MDFALLMWMLQTTLSLFTLRESKYSYYFYQKRKQTQQQTFYISFINNSCFTVSFLCYLVQTTRVKYVFIYQKACKIIETINVYREDRKFKLKYSKNDLHQTIINVHEKGYSDSFNENADTTRCVPYLRIFFSRNEVMRKAFELGQTIMNIMLDNPTK